MKRSTLIITVYQKDKTIIMKVDKIIYSKRKTLAIIVDNKANVIVRAPLKTPRKTIERFVNEKKSWISAKKDEILEKLKEIPQRSFIENERILFLGKEYDLRFIEGMIYPVIFDEGGFLLSKEYKDHAKEILEMWYKKEAKLLFYDKANHFSQAMNLRFNKVKISNAEKRWGSCSSKKNINLSWKLIMAPEKVIDYVIIHELAHLMELNHSKRFWKIVESFDPEYHYSIYWLKENGHLLTI